MKFPFLRALVILGLQLASFANATEHVAGTPANVMPKEFEGAGITEQLGSQVNLDLVFKDENGVEKPLRSIVNGSKPIFLGMVYYGCPNLCNFFMNGVNDVMKKTKWSPGKEFEVVFVSIDPREGPDLAKEKKANYMKEYNRPGTEGGWHFLTGNQANIAELAKQVGFGYKWDDDSQQWAHSAAGILLTPNGQIARYLYGIMFEEPTLRLSLAEASNNRIGGVFEKMVLFCFKFDPTKNKYSLYAFNIMRASAGLTVLLMALFLIPYWRRNNVFRQRGDSNV
ncbi:MAG: SCO family protein [Bdellovibrionales bacterium]